MEVFVCNTTHKLMFCGVIVGQTMYTLLTSAVVFSLCMSCMAVKETLYMVRENTHLASDSLGEKAAISHLNCAQLCIMDSDCVAANYDQGTSNCELMASSHGATSVQSGSSLILQARQPGIFNYV